MRRDFDNPSATFLSVTFFFLFFSFISDTILVVTNQAVRTHVLGVFITQYYYKHYRLFIVFVFLT